MIDDREFLQIASRDVDAPAIRIAAGRRKPVRNGPGGRSTSDDLARARLISDLAGRFALGGKEISAIMALIGQVRALQKMLRALLATGMQLQAPLRARLHAELKDRQTAARRDHRRREALTYFPEGSGHDHGR
jgi:hypothetical protein